MIYFQNENSNLQQWFAHHISEIEDGSYHHPSAHTASLFPQNAWNEDGLEGLCNSFAAMSLNNGSDLEALSLQSAAVQTHDLFQHQFSDEEEEDEIDSRGIEIPIEIIRRCLDTGSRSMPELQELERKRTNTTPESEELSSDEFSETNESSLLEEENRDIDMNDVFFRPITN
jgi:hypothetical protein